MFRGVFRSVMTPAQFLLLVQAVLSALSSYRNELKKFRRSFKETIPKEAELAHQLVGILPHLRTLVSSTGRLCAAVSPDVTISELWENPTPEFIQVVRDYQIVIEHNTAFYNAIRTQGVYFDTIRTSCSLTKFDDSILKFLGGCLADFYSAPCFCDFASMYADDDTHVLNCQNGNCQYGLNQDRMKGLQGSPSTLKTRFMGSIPYCRWKKEILFHECDKHCSVMWRRSKFPNDIYLVPLYKVEEYFKQQYS